jgi:pimeloyl-ACP methyl ester carboxylesterase
MITTRRLRHVFGILATVAAYLAASGLASSPAAADADPPISSAAPGIDAFYTPPSPLPPGSPGDLIRAEMTTVSFLPGVAVQGVKAWRIMYRSTDAQDQPIAATGTLIVPQVPWLLGKRPLVGYGVGAHGSGQQCTPSIQLHQGLQFEAPVISTYLAQNWAVVIPDYQRLPAHTIGISKTSGQVTLDAARAATRIAGSGITAENPLAFSGYSQGGHAAAAAAERQPDYAPELNLKGVVAGGVPADLRAVANAVDGGVLFGVVPMAVVSLKTAYPALSLDAFNASGKAAFAAVATQCIPEISTAWAFHDFTELTVGGKTFDELMDERPEYAAAVDAQKLGQLKPGVPVLTYSGLFDPWIPIEVTQQLHDDWCDQGANVSFSTYPIAEHMGALGQGIPEVLAWLSARFAGLPAPSDC